MPGVFHEVRFLLQYQIHGGQRKKNREYLDADSCGEVVMRPLIMNFFAGDDKQIPKSLTSEVLSMQGYISVDSNANVSVSVDVV